MNFIKLTIGEKSVWINVDRVDMFRLFNGATRIIMGGGVTLHVNETPEEIMAKEQEDG